MSDRTATFGQNTNSFKINVKVANLTNRTTQVEIRNGKRFFGGKADLKSPPFNIEFVEFTEDGIRMDIPPRTCATGHKLELVIEFITPQKTIKFRSQGTVESVEAIPDRHDNIVASLNSYDANEWYFIQKLFRQRQSSVTDLFEKLKGDR